MAAGKRKQEPIRELDYGRGYVYCPSRGDGVAKIKDSSGKERAMATGSERVCVELCWYYTKVANHHHCMYNCKLADWERAIPDGALVVCGGCGREVLHVISAKCPACGTPFNSGAGDGDDPDLPVVFWSPGDLIDDNNEEEEIIQWKVYGT